MSKLRELLEQPAFEWLIDRLVLRIEQGRRLDRGTVTLKNATEAQRRAIDNLLGRSSSSGKNLSVNLEKLSNRLHADLYSLVTNIRGPQQNRMAEREAEDRAWTDVIENWHARLQDQTFATAWLNAMMKDGMLKRLAERDAKKAHALLEHAWQILRQDTHEDVLLASLAARITGDSHALDRGRPLATLCLRAVKERYGIDGGADAAARRDAWAAIGVVVDDLSAPVLCLNLRADPDTDNASWLAWHAERGEPFFLSWRQIKTFVPDPDLVAVHVCENPAVVSEAANRLGPRSLPLVCLNGLPTAAAKALLSRIADAQITLWLRADFDWTGLRIVDEVYEPSSMRLWRMNTENYLACRGSQALTGTAYIRYWNRELAQTMYAAGYAGYEEQIIDRLVEDLRHKS